MKEGNKNIEDEGNTEKGIRCALWLYVDATLILF